MWEALKNILIDEENEIKNSAILQYRQTVGFDKASTGLSNLFKQREYGFIGINFNGKDTLLSFRYRTIYYGITYFEHYLKYLKNKLQDTSFQEVDLLNKVDDILGYTKTVKEIFEKLLKIAMEEIEKDTDSGEYTENYDSIPKLLKSFSSYCRRREIDLIEVS